MPCSCQPQRLRLDARIGDGNAAQPMWKPRHRIEHHAIIVDMRIALHDEAIGEAETIKERYEAFDRHVGRRIATPGLIGKLVGWSENVRVRVPGAGRRHLTRTARMRHRASDTRRLVGEIHLNFPRSATSPWRGGGR